MEGDVGVVSEDVKHGEEVNIEEEWAEDRALGPVVPTFDKNSVRNALAKLACAISLAICKSSCSDN